MGMGEFLVAYEEKTWTADWPKRLKARLRAIGFETVDDFLRRYPGESSIDVAKRIAPWVAAMQLERLQLLEAKLLGRVRYAAFDVGWPREPDMD